MGRAAGTFKHFFYQTEHAPFLTEVNEIKIIKVQFCKKIKSYDFT